MVGDEGQARAGRTSLPGAGERDAEQEDAPVLAGIEPRRLAPAGDRLGGASILHVDGGERAVGAREAGIARDGKRQRLPRRIAAVGDQLDRAQLDQ